METRLKYTRNRAPRGFTAIEVAIFMVAALVVASISSVAALDLGNSTAESGKQAVNDGFQEAVGTLTVSGPVIAARGDVDIDGDGSINLSGNDRQAVARLKFLLTADIRGGIDLTPPYVTDDTGVDPDVNASQPATFISLTTENFSAPSAAWTVTFPGADDGDNHLDRGEQAEVTVWLHPFDWTDAVYDLGTGTSDPYVDSASKLLLERGQLTLRIMPPNAPSTIVTRTLPLELTSTVVLE